VRVNFQRCSADAAGVGVTVTSYEIFRSLFPSGIVHVGSHPATGDDEYGSVVLTATNANLSALAYSAFAVIAYTSSSTGFYSGEELGCSIDNLTPPPPTQLAAYYTSGATHLHWGANPAPDLAGFRLYRGTSADFMPAEDNRVANTAGAEYEDGGPAGRYYKVSAVDVNENESSHAFVGPEQTTDAPAPGVSAIEFALEGASPNPAIGRRVLVHFALPSDKPATLELLDVAGRRVRERAVGMLGAGRHVVDLGTGQRIEPGLYFIRLTQGANQRVARATVVD